MPDRGQPFTDKEFAELLGVSPATEKYWYANGTGPDFFEQKTADGVKRLYTPDAIREWCLAHRFMREAEASPPAIEPSATASESDLPRVLGGAFQADG